MELLLTVLSGVALIAFLLILLALLDRIRMALASINGSLSKVAMGVRAIEAETAILPAQLPVTAATLTRITEGAEALSGILASADGHLAQLAPQEN
jgi:inner membrane protein involved in colicin E2 resistance